MPKHIHIHLAPGMRVLGARTGDADNWDESKHKRADDGKFGSGGGNKTAPTEPVSMKESETHPWVHKFVRTHSTRAEMQAAIAKNETPAIKQVLAGLEKHQHQGATQKMVKELLAAELKKRNA